jgi:hypothetical protein
MYLEYHTVKKGSRFSRPQPGSDISAGDGKTANLFYSAQFMSPRPNWDPPLSRKSMCHSPHPRNREGGHTRLWVRRGVGSQFVRLEKKPSTLSTLWSGTRKTMRIFYACAFSGLGKSLFCFEVPTLRIDYKSRIFKVKIIQTYSAEHESFSYLFHTVSALLRALGNSYLTFFASAPLKEKLLSLKFPWMGAGGERGGGRR